MPKVPYFPFYASDWLGSRKVMLMSDAQRGIYITLIAYQWSEPSCSIPTDKELLRKMLPGSRQKNIEYVVRECFEVDRLNGDIARNVRTFVEHCKTIRKSEKAKHSVNCREEQRKQRSNDDRTMIERSSPQNQNQNQNHIKKNLKNTATPKTGVADPRVKAVIDYFFRKCEEVKGFRPAINGGQDGVRVKSALKILGTVGVYDAIDFFLTNEKADAVGITLSIALSAHSINVFQQGGLTGDRLQNAGGGGRPRRESTAARALRQIRENSAGGTPDVHAGGNERRRAAVMGETVINGAAVEIKEGE